LNVNLITNWCVIFFEWEYVLYICFVESAEIHGNLYGSSIKAVRDVALQGKTCLLEIDVQVPLTHIFIYSYEFPKDLREETRFVFWKLLLFTTQQTLVFIITNNISNNVSDWICVCVCVYIYI
jgi:hypothetical protein